MERWEQKMLELLRVVSVARLHVDHDLDAGALAGHLVGLQGLLQAEVVRHQGLHVDLTTGYHVQRDRVPGGIRYI